VVILGCLQKEDNLQYAVCKECCGFPTEGGKKGNYDLRLFGERPHVKAQVVLREQRRAFVNLIDVELKLDAVTFVERYLGSRYIAQQQPDTK
jgi:hypothetical protein